MTHLFYIYLGVIPVWVYVSVRWFPWSPPGMSASRVGAAIIQAFLWPLGGAIWISLIVYERDEERKNAEQLAAALKAARDELAHWGWGDFHYGDFGQEQRVIDAIENCEKALRHHRSWQHWKET